MPERDYRYIEINRSLRQSHPRLLSEIVAGIETAGGHANFDPVNELLYINGEFTASLVIARCFETERGSVRWRIRFDTGLVPDITVAARMDPSNEQPQDYYIFPSLDLNVGRIRLSENNALSLDAYRFSSLDFFYSMAARSGFREAA
jgi:hypothetical protein